MHNRKVRVLLSVLLVLSVFLPSFSVYSSAAEINASAYALSAESVSCYYISSSGVIEERYVSSYSQELNSFPGSIQIPYDYRDADRKAVFMIMDVTFTDDAKFYNTDYRLQFKSSNDVYLYSYVMNLPDSYNNGAVSAEMILSQTSIAFTTAFSSRDVGDVYRYPVTMNNDIISQFKSSFGANFVNNITTDNGSITVGGVFSTDFHIPANQTMLYISPGTDYESPLPRTLRIFLYIYQSSGNQTSLNLSDFTLIPINGTEQYYQDEIFQNDVIGSDEEGSESGLKGIISFLKNLPGRILDGIASFFVPSEGFFEVAYNKADLFMSQHFGFIYQSLDFVIDIIRFVATSLDELSDKLPENSYLYFPSGSIYLSGDPPDGQSFIMTDFTTSFDTAIQGDLSTYTKISLIPDNSEGIEPPGYYIRFSFLSKAPYDFLYSIYIVAAYCILTILFIYHWYNRARMVLR